MRSCERFELLASLVLDGEATGAEQAELTAHLADCPDCRAYFEDIQRIHKTFAREEAVVPEGFSARVMERVRETEQDRPAEEKKVVPFPRWRRWAALAACCAVAVLSVWAVRGTMDRKEAVVVSDAAPQMSMDMRAVADSPAVKEPDVSGVYAGSNVETADDGMPSEAPPELPEQYKEVAKSTIKDGAAEGFYQPLVNDAPDSQEPVAAAAPSSFPVDKTDALPDEEFSPEIERTDAAAEIEDVPAAENQGAPEVTAPEAAQPVPEAVPDAEEDTPEAVRDNAEEPVEGGEDIEEDVEPVDVIGVPEQGILIVYGSAAREWLESALGLEWAEGGSYPLTAEQYGSLLQILDEAGELYRVEPGEGYCLMTE